MTEITDLSPTDSSNTTVTGESIDGAVANMGRMDNTLQAILGLMARSIRTNVLRFLDNADPTKKVALDLTGLPTATERTWTAPYYSGTLGLVSDIRGQIYGLTLSNNVTDATNDIDIAAGAAVDTTGSVSMRLLAALGKSLDAAWAVGGTPASPNGGLDTGVVGNNWYYVFIIRRPDTGVVDALFSLSSISPTLPANYTQVRRIGSIQRIAGVNRPFTQDGDNFYWSTPFGDVAVAAPGTAAVNRTLSVPPGIPVTALTSLGVVDSSSDGNTTWYYVSSTASSDTAPSAAAFSVASLANVGEFSASSSRGEIYVPSAGQVRTRVSRSTNITIYITTLGWVDNRIA